MDFDSITRALAMIFVIFIIFTVGGAILTAVLIRIEPMLLPTFSSLDMLEGYLQWRKWLATGINFSAFALSISMSFILLMGGIRVAYNVWDVIKGG